MLSSSSPEVKPTLGDLSTHFRNVPPTYFIRQRKSARSDVLAQGSRVSNRLIFKIIFASKHAAGRHRALPPVQWTVASSGAEQAEETRCMAF